jgi:hypothetical protein
MGRIIVWRIAATEFLRMFYAGLIDFSESRAFCGRRASSLLVLGASEVAGLHIAG